MKIQPFLIPDDEGNTHEVTVMCKAFGKDTEAVAKPIFSGSLEECEEFKRTCQVNRAGDSSREGDL